MDERGVSIPLTHALTFGMTAVLVIALLSTAGGFLQSQEEQVGENQFGDINSDIVSQLNSLDRLNQSGENVSAHIEPGYPDRVLGDTYTVTVTEVDGTVTVSIESSRVSEIPPKQTTLESDIEDGEFESLDTALCISDGGTIKVGGDCDE